MSLVQTARVLQVLLSCSHVFHQTCLKSFERYTSTRCCPICRAQHYQKKVIDDGRRAYLHQCATRIQSHWRGYRARRRYWEWLVNHPPAHPDSRRRWLERKLSMRSASLVCSLADTSPDIDSLFAELDASLAGSKLVYEAAGSQLRGIALSRMQIASGGPCRLEGAPHAALQPGATLDARTCGAATGARDWSAVLETCHKRGQEDCPICMGALQGSSRKLAYLSCAHCYHLSCISAFEAFEFSRSETPCCPVCRADYERCTV